MVPDSPAALTADPDLAVVHDDGRVATVGTTTAPTHTAPVGTTARRSRRWMWITVGIVSAIALVLAGTGIGYAMGASTRADLSSAQTQVTTLSQQIASLQAQMDSAAKANAAINQRAASCQTAMTASSDLTAQWRNLWSDMGDLLNASSESEANAILVHMNKQYDAMQQEQGRVSTLMETCTGSAA